ncbi:hypothetical protein ACFPYM_14110, partial [Methylobacterium hispanicum]
MKGTAQSCTVAPLSAGLRPDPPASQGTLPRRGGRENSRVLLALALLAALPHPARAAEALVTVQG